MTVEENDDSGPVQWFALRVKSRAEKVVAMMARNKGFEEFLPIYRSRHQWSDRTKSVEMPLFPGYVFCRLNPTAPTASSDDSRRTSFRGHRKGSSSHRGDRNHAAIRRAVESGLSTEPWPFLEVGQRVRLEGGPLAGLEGILIRSSKSSSGWLCP